jgi:integrase/recombinase XerD
MSALREAMVDKMLLKGFTPRTQKSYLDAVSLLARHYHASPDTLDPVAIQNWLLYLVKERQLAPATCRLYLNAVRFFYLQVLSWPQCELVLDAPKRQQRIPDLLSCSEVRAIIEHATHPKYRTMFAVCYACGLRVSELVALKVRHIHSEQSYLQVIQGKGSKDRNLPLSASLLQLLRDYWRAFRPRDYLFPSRKPGAAISITAVQKSFTKAKARAGITKVGGIHGLRHAYASHQLAAGMPIHQLKELLGHTDLKSTERYLHWRADSAVADFDLLASTLAGYADE